MYLLDINFVGRYKFYEFSDCDIQYGGHELTHLP